ncbi:MAG: hypothetical protein CME19_23740 [Gemmatimonadetes bacterium]|nr:hypothetical protein [Gemmatimonadota bacterium]
MRVGAPPENPTVLFDGDCGFCRSWVNRLAETASGVDTRPYQQSRSDFPELDETSLSQAVHWIDADGAVTSGAEAAFAYWSRSSWMGRLAQTTYRSIPGFAPLSELAYRLIARSRSVTSLLARTIWGRDMSRPRFRVSGDLFLRGLGLVYLAAFLSLLVQVEGLIGSEGILPAVETLDLIANRFGASGYAEFPSLLWLWSSDTALVALCVLGSVTAMIGCAAPYLWLPWLMNWTLYLSFVSVGRNFMSFQWDALLLEAGFLASIQTGVHASGWARGTGRSSVAFRASPTVYRPVSWAYRWLVFRLMLSSGIVKLTSNDATWRDLTALTRHYETQPLPNLIAWYAHQLPEGWHRFSCGVMFGIELIIPFLFFAPRRLRHLAAILTVGLQVLILLTGNYTFFNILSIILCLWLIEDSRWPERLRERFRTPPVNSGPNLIRRLAIPAICLNLLFASMLLTRSVFRSDITYPEAIKSVYRTLSPFRILNTYGLFAVMTTERPEIVLEGSTDGVYWEPYEFYYKPGAVDRPPPFVAPHQPRLDWQMWFAALGPIRNSPWFYSFAQRLLEGSASVTQMLSQNPFPDTPPRYLRARVYSYRFTSQAIRTETGDWWTRSFTHLFLPPITMPQP